MNFAQGLKALCRAKSDVLNNAKALCRSKRTRLGTRRAHNVCTTSAHNLAHNPHAQPSYAARTSAHNPPPHNLCAQHLRTTPAHKAHRATHNEFFSVKYSSCFNVSRGVT